MSKIEGSPRDRLLAAADELFYAEGVHTVGIDRVIERAGVAKASLYTAFGSKEALVGAYLEARAEARRERILARLEKEPTARDKILAIFDLLGEIAAEPGFKGCAFVNASAEEPLRHGPVREACTRSRTWIRTKFQLLAAEAGVRDAEPLARRLALLYHGTINATSMDGDPSAARDAREVAETLLDAALTARPRGTRRSSHRS